MIMYHMKKQEQKACRLLNVYKVEGRDLVTSLFCCLRFVIRSDTGATCHTETASLFCRVFFASLFLASLFVLVGLFVNGYRFTERDDGSVVLCGFVYSFHYYSTLNRGKTNLRHFFESSGTFLF